MSFEGGSENKMNIDLNFRHFCNNIWSAHSALVHKCSTRRSTCCCGIRMTDSLHKMAAILESCMHEEFPSVIRFLWRISQTFIHCRFIEVYGDQTLSKKQVYEWCDKFKVVARVLRMKNVPTDLLHLWLMPTLVWLMANSWRQASVRLRDIANDLGISFSKHGLRGRRFKMPPPLDSLERSLISMQQELMDFHIVGASVLMYLVLRSKGDTST